MADVGRIYLEGGPIDGSTRWDRGGDRIEVNELPATAPGISSGCHVYTRTDREQNGYTVFEYQSA